MALISAWWKQQMPITQGSAQGASRSLWSSPGAAGGDLDKSRLSPALLCLRQSLFYPASSLL